MTGRKFISGELRQALVTFIIEAVKDIEDWYMSHDEIKQLENLKDHELQEKVDWYDHLLDK